MDMPAVLTEYFPEINIEAISEMMTDYAPALQIVRHTWSHETLQDIARGKVTVPDDVINDALNEHLAADGAVKKLKLTSKENGRLEIFANTRSAGRLEFSGTIEDFVHNPTESYVTYRVRERAMKDHGLASWFFSRISLSMSEKLFGKMDFGEDLPSTIDGNYITLDFKNALDKSELAQAEIKGHRVLDMLEIKSATPHDGYIEFETGLNIPEDVQRAALDILLGRGTSSGDTEETGTVGETESAGEAGSGGDAGNTGDAGADVEAVTDAEAETDAETGTGVDTSSAGAADA